MTHRGRRALALAALLGLPLLAACGSSDDTGGRPSVTIAVSSTSLATQQLRLAEDLGFFDKHGVDVELVTSKGGAQADGAMISGQAQFSADSPGGVITASSQGQQIKAVARLYAGLSGSLVLSKKAAERLGVDADAPVSERLKPPEMPVEERLKALDGLKISFVSASSTLGVTVMSAAESVGAKVQPVYMAQDGMPAALSQGSIDALQASPPFSELGVVSGGGVMWISGPLGEFPEAAVPSASCTLMTKASYIKDHPDIVKKVSAALTEAAQFVVDNPEKARDNIKTRFPNIATDVWNALWEANKGAFVKPHVTADQLAQDMKVLPAELRNDDKVKALNPADLVAEDYSPTDPS